MWLFTDFGFFSVVEKPGDRGDGMLTVRGRVGADMEAFRTRYLPSASEIVTLDRADYRYRFRAPKAEVARAMAAIAAGIDYDDFKATVEEKHGWMRHDIYETVWSTLRTLCHLDQPSADDRQPSAALSGDDPGPVR